jgi:hypothetical protein
VKSIIKSVVNSTVLNRQISGVSNNKVNESWWMRWNRCQCSSK